MEDPTPAQFITETLFSRQVVRPLHCFIFLIGTGNWIRTSTLLLPKQAFYH